ncbi:MAG: nucleotide-binding protein [Candidatus Baldrarchaeia archaeon]
MRRDCKVISISGKGGVGKSTIATLMLRSILKMKNDASILIIDADSASTLAHMLCLPAEKTLADILDSKLRDLPHLMNRYCWRWN